MLAVEAEAVTVLQIRVRLEMAAEALGVMAHTVVWELTDLAEAVAEQVAEPTTVEMVEMVL